MPFLDVLWLLGHGDKVKHDSEVCHLAAMVIRVPKMCCNELPHLKQWKIIKNGQKMGQNYPKMAKNYQQWPNMGQKWPNMNQKWPKMD